MSRSQISKKRQSLEKIKRQLAKTIIRQVKLETNVSYLRSLIEEMEAEIKGEKDVLVAE